MTDFPADWPEIAWGKLPLELRQRAVARLRYAFAPEFFDEVRRLVEQHGTGEWPPTFWHFGQGMHVRNVLRSDEALRETRAPAPFWKRITGGAPRPPAPIPDADLPPLPELYDGQTEGNWDDYYVQCVEAAAGLRGEFA